VCVCECVCETSEGSNIVSPVLDVVLWANMQLFQVSPANMRTPAQLLGWPGVVLVLGLVAILCAALVLCCVSWLCLRRPTPNVVPAPVAQAEESAFTLTMPIRERVSQLFARKRSKRLLSSVSLPSLTNAGFSASTPHLVAVSAIAGSSFPETVDDSTASGNALLEMSDYSNTPTTSSLMTADLVQTSL
jgi:hypothetical protein